jgi:hypothetical protein
VARPASIVTCSPGALHDPGRAGERDRGGRRVGFVRLVVGGVAQLARVVLAECVELAGRGGRDDDPITTPSPWRRRRLLSERSDDWSSSGPGVWGEAQRTFARTGKRQRGCVLESGGSSLERCAGRPGSISPPVLCSRRLGPPTTGLPGLRTHRSRYPCPARPRLSPRTAARTEVCRPQRPTGRVARVCGCARAGVPPGARPLDRDRLSARDRSQSGSILKSYLGEAKSRLPRRQWPQGVCACRRLML